jgi:hypothetical protein
LIRTGMKSLRAWWKGVEGRKSERGAIPVDWGQPNAFPLLLGGDRMLGQTWHLQTGCSGAPWC